MSTFSNAIANWLDNYQQVFAARQQTIIGQTIEVGDAAGKLAFIYEKIRTTVDYKDDHLLRKHAIARMLKRLTTPGAKGSIIALPLIEELIRARYLPNKTILNTAVGQVCHAINKYIVIYNSAIDKNFSSRELKKFYDWLIHLAACEIEEILVPNRENLITIDAMHRVVRQNIILDGDSGLDQAGQDIQVYIAVLKSLIKADELTVNYFLFKYYFPDWQNLTLSQVEKLAVQIWQTKYLIQAHNIHHLNEKLTHEFKKYAVTFWILQDIISQNPQQFQNIFASRERLTEEIKKICHKKYKNIGKKVRTAIVRSVIYIFLTKMIFGLLLEFPYDYFLLAKVQWLPLSINALFPPVLMAVIGMSIRTPKEDNTQAIIAEVDNIVYSSQGKEHRIKIRQPKRGFGFYLSRTIYAVLYLISFGLVIYGLAQLLFSFASMIIFIFFLTMVSFFSLRIRKNAAELIILEQRERFLTVIFTFLAIPVLRVGRWISLHSSKINVFIFILDFFIETPFKIFIRIFEDLVVFVKEKRDEML